MEMDLFSDGFPQIRWDTMFRDSEEVAVRIGEFDIKVLQSPVTDPEVGTGSVLWGSSVFLLKFLEAKARELVAQDEGGKNLISSSCRGPPLAAPPKALELGSGCTALPGVALAMAGFQVCLSDVGLVVPRVRERLEQYAASVQGQGAEETADAIKAMSVEEFDWSDGEAVERWASSDGVDLVACADGDYADFTQQPLVTAAASALAASTSAVAVFCSDGRSASLDFRFEQLLRRTFEVEIMPFGDSEFGSDARASGSRILVARWTSVAEARATKHSLLQRHASKAATADAPATCRHRCVQVA